MTKPLGLVEQRKKAAAGTKRVPSYRAVTIGSEREQWGVVDAQGDVIFLGEARVAAIIANRLTRPAA